MNVDALVDEIHVDIVGVGGDRQGADARLSNAAGREVGGYAVFKFNQCGDVVLPSGWSGVLTAEA